MEICPGIGSVFLCLANLLTHGRELRPVQGGRYRKRNRLRIKTIRQLLSCAIDDLGAEPLLVAQDSFWRRL